MLYVVAVFGALMCAGGLVGLVMPAPIMAIASHVAASRPLRIAAVVVRILLGAVIIIAANSTPYPLALKIIGVVVIMAGTLVGFAGREKLESWIRGIRENPSWLRGMSLASLVLGAFLLHAVN